MVRNDEGLTKTYNRFHNPKERSPEIAELRTLHTSMDRAVLDAYGWTDIPTDYATSSSTTRSTRKPGDEGGSRTGTVGRTIFAMRFSRGC